MNITVIGQGYVGLTTAACLAEMGHTVTGIDIDEERVQRLCAGDVPIFEPGLDELVARNSSAGRLGFSSGYASVPDSDVIFIAVSTPSKSNGDVDLSQIEAVTTTLADLVGSEAVIAVKSTVPAGTTRSIAQRLEDAGCDAAVVANPEFLRQGSAVTDFLNPDRIVVGSLDPGAETVMRDLYAGITATGVPILIGNWETAELVKYAANSFLAAKLSFINEIADLCEAAGASIKDVAAGIGLDDRISDKFLNAGPGYGGSCFPKDTQALLHTGYQYGTPSRIVAAAVTVNQLRIDQMMAKIAGALDRPLRGSTIALLGITFKANTDDLRSSPALGIARRLVSEGVRLQVFDPVGLSNAKLALVGADFASNAYDAAHHADVLVIATEWREFAELDLERLRELLNEPKIVDLRNLYDPERVAAAGFRYVSIGRPDV